MAQRLLAFVIRVILLIIADVEIVGIENVPDSGFIAAVNHIGRLDAAMIYYIFNRQDLILPIAEKYEHHPIFGPLGNAIGGIWLDRFNPDIGAMRMIMKRLKKGGVLFIAPEGTRSKTEALQRGKPGVTFLASKAGIPILPAALTGTEDRVVLDRLKHFRRLHITVRGGKPFFLPPLGAKKRDEALQAETDEIMCRIAALLPEKYRGVYADDPRVKELMEEEYA